MFKNGILGNFVGSKMSKHSFIKQTSQNVHRIKER